MSTQCNTLCLQITNAASYIASGKRSDEADIGSIAKSYIPTCIDKPVIKSCIPDAVAGLINAGTPAFTNNFLAFMGAIASGLSDSDRDEIYDLAKTNLPTDQKNRVDAASGGSPNTCCTAGNYFESTKCVPCPAGWSNPNAGCGKTSSDCQKCAPDKVASAGSSTCTTCPNGYLTNDSITCTYNACATSAAGAPPGYFCSSKNELPKPCTVPRGKFCPGGKAPDDGNGQLCPDRKYCAGGTTLPQAFTNTCDNPPKEFACMQTCMIANDSGMVPKGGTGGAYVGWGCNPGFYYIDLMCVPCSKNMFCPGGLAKDGPGSAVEKNPDNDNCGTSSKTCTNTQCIVVDKLGNPTSKMGAVDAVCGCPAGKYYDTTNGCVICPVDSYCPGGLPSEAKQNPIPGTTTPTCPSPRVIKGVLGDGQVPFDNRGCVSFDCVCPVAQFYDGKTKTCQTCEGNKVNNGNDFKDLGAFWVGQGFYCSGSLTLPMNLCPPAHYCPGEGEPILCTVEKLQPRNYCPGGQGQEVGSPCFYSGSPPTCGGIPTMKPAGSCHRVDLTHCSDQP